VIERSIDNLKVEGDRLLAASEASRRDADRVASTAQHICDQIRSAASEEEDQRLRLQYEHEEQRWRQEEDRRRLSRQNLETFLRTEVRPNAENVEQTKADVGEILPNVGGDLGRAVDPTLDGIDRDHENALRILTDLERRIEDELDEVTQRFPAEPRRWNPPERSSKDSGIGDLTVPLLGGLLGFALGGPVGAIFGAFVPLLFHDYFSDSSVEESEAPDPTSPGAGSFTLPTLTPWEAREPLDEPDFGPPLSFDLGREYTAPSDGIYPDGTIDPNRFDSFVGAPITPPVMPFPQHPYSGDLNPLSPGPDFRVDDYGRIRDPIGFPTDFDVSRTGEITGFGGLPTGLSVGADRYVHDGPFGIGNSIDISSYNSSVPPLNPSLGPPPLNPSLGPPPLNPSLGPPPLNPSLGPPPPFSSSMAPAGPAPLGPPPLAFPMFGGF